MRIPRWDAAPSVDAGHCCTSSREHAIGVDPRSGLGQTSAARVAFHDKAAYGMGMPDARQRGARRSKVPACEDYRRMAMVPEGLAQPYYARQGAISKIYTALFFLGCSIVSTLLPPHFQQKASLWASPLELGVVGRGFAHAACLTPSQPWWRPRRRGWPGRRRACCRPTRAAP